MNITSIDTKQISSIAEQYHLQLVVLYGSYAKGTQRQGSDIDIAVLGFEPPSFKKMLALQNEFFDVCAETDVDVKSLHRVSPFFRYQVMKDGVLLFGDSHLFTRYKVYAIRARQENAKLEYLRDILLKKRQQHLDSLYPS